MAMSRDEFLAAPEHVIAVVCTDALAENPKWISSCWCGKYKSAALPSMEEVLDRAKSHVNQKKKAA